MKQSDLKKVNDFYDNVIRKQIILPLEINEIYLLVAPNEPIMQPYAKKMGAITRFIQGYQQDVLDELEDLFDEVEYIDTEDPRSSNYVHPTKSEDMPPEEQSHQEVINFDTELEILEKGLVNIADTPENKKARTVLKSKITKLKKKK